MAATIRNRTSPDDPLYKKTRAKIQTTQLVKRMNSNALGILKNDVTGELTEMTTSQLRSAEILLSKSLPSLTSTTIEATVDATVTLESQSEDELNARIAELEGKKSPISP